MNCVGWLLGGGVAPVLIGFLALYVSMGEAIALSSAVYLMAGIMLILTMRYFLKDDIRRLEEKSAS